MRRHGREIKRILQSGSIYLNHSDFDVWGYIWGYAKNYHIIKHNYYNIFINEFDPPHPTKTSAEDPLLGDKKDDEWRGNTHPCSVICQGLHANL